MRWTVVCAVSILAGCGAFNPAFVSLVAPGAAQTLDNAPGHVVIGFVNNAEVDERLLAFMESPEGGNLDLTDAEKAELRPRMRLRIQITFTDGSVQTIDFITGSSNLVDPRFDALASPDLNQNDLGNVVVLCDVASVQLEPGSQIEVFIPVELTAFQLVETTTGGGALPTGSVCLPEPRLDLGAGREGTRCSRRLRRVPGPEPRELRDLLPAGTSTVPQWSPRESGAGAPRRPRW